MIFKAHIQLDGAEEILKTITGQLPKIGAAAQKEFNENITNSMKSSGGQTGGMMGTIVTQTVSALANPLMSAQETRIAMMPKIASEMTKLFPYIGDKLAPLVEGIVQAGTMKSKYIYTGARETVAGRVAQLAEIGMTPSDERITEMLKSEAAYKEKAFVGMEKTGELASEAFKGRMGDEAEDVWKAALRVISNLVILVEDIGVSVEKAKQHAGDDAAKSQQEWGIRDAMLKATETLKIVE